MVGLLVYCDDESARATVCVFVEGGRFVEECVVAESLSPDLFDVLVFGFG